MRGQHEKIKATLITGFLGAGKTTFINQLLKQHPEIQFALVENEFGDVSIDTQLIKGVDASQMFELKQGCICCTITNEFELVLQELAVRFPHVQHLLIETTGLADPAAVARPFFAPELADRFQYNGIICVVDALHFWHSPEKELTIKQLVSADLVLVSKSEQLDNNEKVNFKKRLEALQPVARIHFLHANQPSAVWLNAIDDVPKPAYRLAGFSAPDTGIAAKTLRFNHALDKADFVRRLEYFLDIHKNRIYRAKGILCFNNELYAYYLQAVGGSFELSEGDGLLVNQKSEIVFIGKLADVDFDMF